MREFPEHRYGQHQPGEPESPLRGRVLTTLVCMPPEPLDDTQFWLSRADTFAAIAEANLECSKGTTASLDVVRSELGLPST